MKCFRAKLSDRRDPQSSAARKGSPRHYCQRRLADTSLDEREWLKRYTPERYHLDSTDHSESRSTSPDSFRVGPEDRPACLTITTLDFPEDLSTLESNPKSRKRVRYRSLPKTSSAHLHRMFVKGEEETPYEVSRSSSRASSNYDYEFEEYLRNIALPESGECSLFGDEDKAVEEEPLNNNELDYVNREPTPSPVAPLVKETKPAIVTHRKEKRKSLTLSRIPSPETVQVIRIDVISGYPVSSDNSILSEMTENGRSDSEESLKENSSNVENPRVLCDIEKIARKRDFLECERLLNCRSVNLSARYYGGKTF